MSFSRRVSLTVPGPSGVIDPVADVHEQPPLSHATIADMTDNSPMAKTKCEGSGKPE